MLSCVYKNLKDLRLFLGSFCSFCKKSKTKIMQYEDRVTVFLDILGFKSMLNETYDFKKKEDNIEVIDNLVDVYNIISSFWNGGDNSLNEDHITSKFVSTFSDSIVISFRTDNDSAIFRTLSEVKILIMNLIYKGVIVRGAVSYGKLLHNEKMLFGPALVEAYILESKAENYPRIILDRAIIYLAGKYNNGINTSMEEMNFVESLLEKDSDGMYYIDYFFKAQEELDDPLSEFSEYIGKLGNIIRKGMQASSHPSKADIRVKYSWMKEKYNDMVEIVSNKEYLSELKGNYDISLFAFYSSLKKINPNEKLSRNKSRKELLVKNRIAS